MQQEREAMNARRERAQTGTESTLTHLTLLGGSARALVAHTTKVVHTAQRTHETKPTATAALGRMLTGTALLAASLKGEDDTLTLSVRGGGPIGSVICVGKPNGTVKGTVDDPSADPPRHPSGKLNVGGAVGTDGFLTVIRNLGFGEPYVGRTPLVSGEIAEDIATYLLNSEQTPSLVALGVTVHPEEGVLGAGGILVQTMPGITEEEIARLEAFAPELRAISRAAAEAENARDLAERLLHAIEHEALETRELRFACDCSRERMEQVLISTGEDELRDMLDKQHGAEISCHFCNTHYRFSESELAKLIDQAR